MNLLKSFWSFASPKMLGKCKAGVGINPRQPAKKLRQEGRVLGWFKGMEVAEAGWGIQDEDTPPTLARCVTF